jgi:hypothetical protein
MLVAGVLVANPAAPGRFYFWNDASSLATDKMV